MQDHPNLQTVNEVLARLEQSWQVLAKLLKEGQGEPSTQRVESEGFAPKEAAGGQQEGDLSSSEIGNGNRPVSLSIHEAPQTETPEAETPSCTPAPEANLPEPNPERLPPKGWGQKFFNVSVLILLVATVAGLSWLIAQTELARGKLNSGLPITISDKEGPRVSMGKSDGQVILYLLDKAGRSRVNVSLDASGSPCLSLFNELLQKRAELTIGPDGEPVLRQVKKPALPVGQESNAPVPSGNEATASAAAATETAAPKAPRPDAGLPENPGNLKSATIGPAEGPANRGPGPVSALPGETGSNAPSTVPVVKFVGSKTSNKYHYPDCRWAKQIRPEKLVTFSSPEEAREKGYVPCPECKPPKSSGGETPIE